ncbi:hypothetical protein T492DRAFT_597736 [Pavlovales sp. CCMP2436]|nr:hypothetical protein T492DRAFT_597736 [Pavlovales sp. CCMP2436]
MVSLRAAHTNALVEPRLGFIGVGTIASAVVRGLCAGDETPPPSILLGPRSAVTAQALAAEFAGRVSVAPDNQAVVDGCDVLFLSVLPQQASGVLEALCLREDQLLVSLISTASAASLARAARLPESRVVRALPLPAVGERSGVTPLWPAEESVVRIFVRLGGAIAAADERELLTLATVTCLVGQLYAQMGEAQEWLVGRGIARAQASRYVTAVYAGAVSNSQEAAARAQVAAGDAEGDGSNSDVFRALVAEQTAGGINEQMLVAVRDGGAPDAFRGGLQAVHDRLQAGRAGGISPAPSVQPTSQPL